LRSDPTVSTKGFGTEKLAAGDRRDVGLGEDVMLQTMTKASWAFAFIDW